MICDCCHRDFAHADISFIRDSYSDSAIAICFLCTSNKCGTCYSGKMRCLQYPDCENTTLDSGPSREFCSEPCAKTYKEKRIKSEKLLESVIRVSGIPADEILI